MTRALLSATPLLWAFLPASLWSPVAEPVWHQPIGTQHQVAAHAASSGEPDPCLGGEDCDPPVADDEQLVPTPDPISTRVL